MNHIFERYFKYFQILSGMMVRTFSFNTRFSAVPPPFTRGRCRETPKKVLETFSPAPRVKKQSGSALLAVLVVMVLGGLIAGYMFQRTLGDTQAWLNDRDRLQALYLAEAGMAHQIYLEKYGDPPSDSVEILDGEAPLPIDGGTITDKDTLPADLRFYLNPDLPLPSISSSREGAYLEIVSSALFEETRAVVTARFGRALDDSIFSSALVLASAMPLEPGSEDNIIGIIRVKSPPGIPVQGVLPLGPAFDLRSLIGTFSSDLDNYFRSELNLKLSREGGESGNGYFGEGVLPDFSAVEDVFFPLGDIHIAHSGSDCLEITGPGAFYAHGDIFVEGCVVLKNIQLWAGRGIQFRDSIFSENLTAYSGKDIRIEDRCHLDIQATAQENIYLGGTAQTTVQSMLHSIGRQGKTSQPHDRQGSLPGTPQNKTGQPMVHAYGIRMADQAAARGLILAAGAQGALIMNSGENLVEGAVIAMKNAWISGRIYGCVVTEQLRCGREGEQNCLDQGEIDRTKMPLQMTLPLELGGGDRSSWAFRLVDWKVEYEK